MFTSISRETNSCCVHVGSLVLHVGGRVYLVIVWAWLSPGRSFSACAGPDLLPLLNFTVNKIQYHKHNKEYMNRSNDYVCL